MKTINRSIIKGQRIDEDCKTARVSSAKLIKMLNNIHFINII